MITNVRIVLNEYKKELDEERPAQLDFIHELCCKAEQMGVGAFEYFVKEVVNKQLSGMDQALFWYWFWQRMSVNY